MSDHPDTGIPPDAIPLGEIVAGLREARREWRAHHDRQETRGREFPSPELLADVVHGLRGALFPLRLGPADLRREAEDYYIGHTLDAALQTLNAQIRLELHDQDPDQDEAAIAAQAARINRSFAVALPEIRRVLDQDVLAAFQGDRAASSVDEVLLCYPGIEAMIHHRLAHPLYLAGVPLIARIIAELAHTRTGIDLHPGAHIGPGLFIDHGTGVVIGETAIIGQRVRIYQAVTLGARSFPLDEHGQIKKGAPRHPIVEDEVVIYAGATVLGRVTIGRGSTIGGNVWLTHSVPPGSHITQASTQQRSPLAA